MKRAKYYLGLISLLLFMVSCAVDGGEEKIQEDENISNVSKDFSGLLSIEEALQMGIDVNYLLEYANNKDENVKIATRGTKPYPLNGYVNNHTNVYVTVQSDDKGYYYINPYSESNLYSDDVDFIIHPQTQNWYKISANKVGVHEFNGNFYLVSALPLTQQNP